MILHCINLLRVIIKVYEKLLMKHLMLIIEENDLIPDHQLDFCSKQSIVEYIHVITYVVNKSLEANMFCLVVSLDVSQAIDKLWHSRFLYKVKKSLPHNFYCILKYYIEGRQSQVKFSNAAPALRPKNTGELQYSVLGLQLYLMAPQTYHQAVTQLLLRNRITLHYLQSFLIHHMCLLLQKKLNNIIMVEKWPIEMNTTKYIHDMFYHTESQPSTSNNLQKNNSTS